MPEDTPQAQHVRQELSEQSTTLHELLTAARARPEGLSVGDYDHQHGLLLHDWPVAGSERVVVRRTGSGFDGLAVPQTAQPPVLSRIVNASVARLGLQITNIGAFPVVLYLTDRPVPAPGAPAIYLAANGGANSYWRGLIGQTPWCGNVSAVAIGGASSVAICDI
jgi:hypothetical protein